MTRRSGAPRALLWTAPAEAMALFAERIVEVHGSMAGWPAGLGVSPSTIDRLRDRLVTDR